MLVATTGVLPVFLAGAVGVQLRGELHFGEAGLGRALSVAFLVSALFSALFGRVVEAMGPIRSMRFAAGLSALTLLAVAIGAHSLLSLSVILIGGGIANAISQPATNLYVTRVVPAHRQGLAFAIKQSAIPAATLLGGLAVPAVALTVGWRWAFVGGAGLAVIGGFATGEVVGSKSGGPRASPARRDQRLPTLVTLGVGVGAGALAAASLGAFATSAFTEAGFAAGNAGLLAALGSALVVAVRLVLGHHADRRDRAGMFPVIVVMMILGAAGFALMATMQPAPMLVGAMCAYSFGWGWPGLFNLAIAQANPSAPAAASGVTQTGTYLGVAVGPFLFGLLAEGPGYRAAWLLAAIAALIGATFVWLGSRSVLAVPVGVAGPGQNSVR